MNLTNKQLEKAKQARNAKELLALAREHGLKLTAEEAEKYYDGLHKEDGSSGGKSAAGEIAAADFAAASAASRELTYGELSDEELENAAGGGICDPEPVIYTKMICEECNCNTFWTGNYVDGIAYECPMCLRKKFFGRWTADSTGW